MHYHIEFVYFDILTHRIPIKNEEREKTTTNQPLVELNNDVHLPFFHHRILRIFSVVLSVSQPLNMCLRMSASFAANTHTVHAGQSARFHVYAYRLSSNCDEHLDTDAHSHTHTHILTHHTKNLRSKINISIDKYMNEVILHTYVALFVAALYRVISRLWF